MVFKLIIFVLIIFVQSLSFSWEVDLSRRRKDLRRRGLASVEKQPSSTEKVKDLILHSVKRRGPIQEVVVLNTKDGFIPKTLRLRKDQEYVIHVVNVNEKEKNVSFVMDAFSEHHATYFGRKKTFSVSPKKEGVYSFQCPETAEQGKVVVYSSDQQRQPASY